MQCFLTTTFCFSRQPSSRTNSIGKVTIIVAPRAIHALQRKLKGASVDLPAAAEAEVDVCPGDDAVVKEKLHRNPMTPVWASVWQHSQGTTLSYPRNHVREIRESTLFCRLYVAQRTGRRNRERSEPAYSFGAGSRPALSPSPRQTRRTHGESTGECLGGDTSRSYPTRWLRSRTRGSCPVCLQRSSSPGGMWRKWPEKFAACQQ